MLGMKNRFPLAACLIACSLAAHANEGLDLAIKSKSMAAAASVAKPSPAPFVAGRDPAAELFLAAEQDRHGMAGRCEAAATELCYDAVEGRLTYRGARQFMPAVGGMTAEGIQLRRDRIVLRYSFK
jgi:hypothetical protein